MTGETNSEVSPDGRRRRSQVSRDRIVEAMITLVAEGAISPGAEDVATRAGVGLRSVFRHFRDMESLYREMTRQLGQSYQLWLIPFVATDWRGQLGEIIDRRLVTYERMLPFKRSSDAHRHESPVIEDEYRRLRAMMRGRLQSIVADLFEDNPIALETLDMLISIDVWQRLRIEQRLDVEVARRIVEQQVDLLLASTMPGRR